MVKNSFTLIELIVMTTVILLLSTFSFAWYRNINEDKTLSQQELQLKNALETAKVSAETGNTSLCTNRSTAYLSSFSTVITASGVELKPYCDTVPTIITYPIDSHIVFVQPSQEISFDSYGHTTGTCITLQYANTTRSKNVRISDNGLITSESSCTPTP